MKTEENGRGKRRDLQMIKKVIEYKIEIKR